MSDIYHFFGKRHPFGVIKMEDDCSAVIFVPSKEERPFRFHSTKITDYAIDDEKTKALEGVLQHLKLRDIWIYEESLHKPTSAEGSYYPRVWRGLYNPADPLSCYLPIRARETYGSAFVQSMAAARSLFEALTDLFRYVEPSRANDTAYSHRIRELLILACTELEASWRGVCEDNSIEPLGSRFCTKDYVRLSAPLGLPEWSVELVDYPDYGPISPFSEWNASSPTQTIPWYDAYNSVKHNRERNFTSGSTLHLVSSMAALHIQVSAQWGPNVFDRWFEATPSPFRIVRQPTRAAGDIYAPRIEGDLSLHWARTPLCQTESANPLDCPGCP